MRRTDASDGFSPARSCRFILHTPSANRAAAPARAKELCRAWFGSAILWRHAFFGDGRADGHRIAGQTTAGNVVPQVSAGAAPRGLAGRSAGVLGGALRAIRRRAHQQRSDRHHRPRASPDGRYGDVSRADVWLDSIIHGGVERAFTSCPAGRDTRLGPPHCPTALPACPRPPDGRSRARILDLPPRAPCGRSARQAGRLSGGGGSRQ